MRPPAPRAFALLIVVVGGCLAAPAAGYVRSRTDDGAPLEWNARSMPWSLNELGSDDIDIDTLAAEVIASFDPWTEQVCAELAFPYEGLTARGTELADIGYESGGDNINVVAFREELDDWMHASDAVAITCVTYCLERRGVCDLAGEILDADIEVNGARFVFDVVEEPGGRRFDLRNTLTHEVGHFIGFDHTPIATATMFATTPVGEVAKRDLDDDDIDGLCDVYSTIYSERNPEAEGCECSAADDRSGPGWGTLALLCALVSLRRRRPAR